MFDRIKAGDTVVSKKTGIQGTVEQVSYDKIFVRMMGNLSGKVTGTWCDKSAFKKVK